MIFQKDAHYDGIDKLIHQGMEYFNSEDIINNGLIIMPLVNGGYRTFYDYDLPLINVDIDQIEDALPYLQSDIQINELDYILPKVYVDSETGDAYWLNSLVQDTVSGNVLGSIYPSYTDAPPILDLIKDEWININGNQLLTDELGFYQISGLVNPVVLDISLEGPWAIVDNSQDTNAFHSAELTAPTTYNINWLDFDTSYENQETNVFYHINSVTCHPSH